MDYRTLTVDRLLRAGLRRAPGGWRLTLDPAFQGLPETAHGGCLLAVVHALAGAPPAALARARCLRRVPLGVPLAVTLEDGLGGWTCRLALAEAPAQALVDGAVERADPRGSGAPPGPSPPAAPVALHPTATPLPISTTCFACGRDNPVGLRAALACDATAVAGTWQPRPPLVTADGTLAPVALTALLDEAAFWLGALATGESGLTTELAVRLHGAVAADRALLVGGRRADARRRAADPRYVDTAVAAWTAEGTLVAEAWITFVAVRGAARRLVAWMRDVNPPEVLRRVFPAYAA